ncbi:DnaJ and TPR domain-containing protein [Sodiomyces alkalinus F11]|uniref:Tetratricopeptide repeat and J domain-containing co-chaperone DNJ1 n=1 Tax=Sodiomyces alkalinus (strain CBS 110278 / VKM F-3762 / F11) TaxID=1314773 RepID=A0A3N2Q7F6_SODAK|nr:DnaJ and TPR domain-containing protein [Sodiomyces alkalinus F11]ROT42690.1 DnaJ and TPR domain-containing protein [Sodiomyces alkalinus F11]
MMVKASTFALAAGLISVSFVSALSADNIPADIPVSALLDSAQTHLSRGETSDALLFYDAAIARDPSNYLSLFKRATTYLSLGRTSQATEDFNRVLTLKPGFEGAHVQLAKIKSRNADWVGAREHYVLANKDASSAEMAALDQAESEAHLAKAAEKAGDYEACVHHAGEALMMANRALSLRDMRSRCRFARGEIEEGLGDLQYVLQLRPGDVAPHLTVSATTFYGLGNLDAGMTQAKKCLHSDPDSKPCKKLLKQQKTIDKILGKVSKAFEKNQPMTGVKLLIDTAQEPGLINIITAQEEDLRQKGFIPSRAPSDLYMRVVEMACEGYYEMNGKKTKQYCGDVLTLNPESFFGLLHQARDLMDREEFEDAVRTLQKLDDSRPDKRNVVQPLLQKARLALKRSRTKDYYKVLGVPNDADDRQIKSAYRKLSKIHHPDKAVRQRMTKEEAEKKMASINEAYEVLSNPELRARFDHGDDPNDTEQRGHPFQQGHPFGSPFMFQQGGGGGQQYKFHFGGGGGGFGGFPF